MASRNYINNREMYNALCEYLTKRKEAEEAGKTLPQIPKYLAECFLQIANRLGTKANFAYYSYLEEMKSDGVMNCIQYIKNFNPEKSNNPFAYFTQIIKFAFIRRIEQEKKQLYVKYKNYQNLNVQEDLAGEGVGGPELNEISNDYIDTFEKKLLTARKKNVKVEPANTVTQFFEE